MLHSAVIASSFALWTIAALYPFRDGAPTSAGEVDCRALGARVDLLGATMLSATLVLLVADRSDACWKEGPSSW